MQTLDLLKLQLQVDPGSYNAEWEIVNNILEQTPNESDEILKWVFEEHKGYVDTRSRAGMAYYHNNEKATWNILHQLSYSNDPDDRDTALSVASSIGDTQATSLVRHLLHDSYPYIRLGAAEFLVGDFPDDVKVCLQQLAKEDAKWLRDSANELILRMTKD